MVPDLMRILCVFLWTIVPAISQQDVPKVTLQDLEEEFDFVGGPGVQHEFKYEVSAGRMDCFHQFVKDHATLHVSFEVLRGADKNIDFIVKSPQGRVIAHHQWTNEGQTDQELMAAEGGYYSFCIDNTYSRFSAKLVYIFLVTYVEEDWEDLAAESEDFSMSVDDIKTSVSGVFRSIAEMKKYQGMSRRHLASDYYTITRTNSSVGRWSLCICLATLLSTTVQVVFVRRLFKYTNTTRTPTSKPRA